MLIKAAPGPEGDKHQGQATFLHEGDGVVIAIVEGRTKGRHLCGEVVDEPVAAQRVGPEVSRGGWFGGHVPYPVPAYRLPRAACIGPV
jgi:hypothetical protein